MLRLLLIRSASLPASVVYDRRVLGWSSRRSRRRQELAGEGVRPAALSDIARIRSFVRSVGRRAELVVTSFDAAWQRRFRDNRRARGAVGRQLRRETRAVVSAAAAARR